MATTASKTTMVLLLFVLLAAATHAFAPPPIRQPPSRIPPLHGSRRQFVSQLFVLSAPKASYNATDLKLREELATTTKSLAHVLNIDPDASLTMPPPQVVGHRGCPYLEMENTRAAFERCQDMGCDAVELDVFSLKCGTLVVFHGTGSDENPGLLEGYIDNDSDLDIVGKGILDYTYDEILQQDWVFNTHNLEFPCPPERIRKASIPTLEQVLTDIKKSKKNKDLHVTMELKGGFNLVPNVMDLVDKIDASHFTSCSSFNFDYLRQVRDIKPEKDPRTGQYLYKTGALFNDLDVTSDGKDIIDTATAAGADEVHLRYDTCTPQLIDKLHDHGFASMAWFRGPIGMAYDVECNCLDVGNEDEAMYEAVWRTGVQKLCVNKPDVLLGLNRKVTELKKQQSAAMA